MKTIFIMFAVFGVLLFLIVGFLSSQQDKVKAVCNGGGVIHAKAEMIYCDDGRVFLADGRELKTLN